jgi:hypothetical protein
MTEEDFVMTFQTVSDLFSKNIFNDTTLHKGLGEEISLCDNGNMSFHWADFHETCDAIKQQLENDQQLKHDFNKKEEAIRRLNIIPVWIRTSSRIIQTTMHNLYEQYLLNQKQSMGVDPFSPIAISFISATGPFKTMAVSECFNLTTYRDFVLVYLIQGKLPKRDFRIRLKSKVLLEFGADFQQAQLVHIEQLTTSGLLLSIDSSIFDKHLAHGGEMRLLIDTGMLRDAIGKDLQGLKSYLSSFAFNLMYSSRKEDAIAFNLNDFSVQSSFNFLKNKKVYIYAGYSVLGNSAPASIKNIQDFVGHTKELVREHFKQMATAKSA